MLGKRLALARKKAGLSQRQLACEMGERYDQTMISHVESGRSGLVGEGLSKVATVLGISIDYLFGFTEDPTPASQLALARDAANIVQFPMVAAVVGSAADQVVSVGVERTEYDSTILDVVSFSRGFLKELGVTSDNCHLVKIQGDRMEPTLPDGCTVIVDLDSQAYRDGSIFVMQLEQQIVEKIERSLEPVRLILERSTFEGDYYEDWRIWYDNDDCHDHDPARLLRYYDMKRVIGEVVAVITPPKRRN